VKLFEFPRCATMASSQVKGEQSLFAVAARSEVVKAGQTVAMDISRSVKEGESSELSPLKNHLQRNRRNRNTNETALATKTTESETKH